MNTITTTPLMAVCDALVVSALTTLGKRLLRTSRSHYLELEFSGRRIHEAHLVWQADMVTTLKSLDNAWDDLDRLVSLHGPEGVDVQALKHALNSYVGHIVSAQIAHDFSYMVQYLNTEVWCA